jgi:hypothetical protein
LLFSVDNNNRFESNLQTVFGWILNLKSAKLLHIAGLRSLEI